MTARFLAIGECMIELAPAGDGHFAMGFAGDTFNTAWYLRRLAAPSLEVAYFSAIGDDDPSRAMTAFMRGAGIRPELIMRPGGQVGLYMISLKDGERSFSYWRATSAARSLADDLERLPGIGPGDTAFFSGITLAILPDEGRRRLLAALDAARGAGARIAFDPNLRPRLWRSAEEMRHWVSAGAAAADIALPSFEDEAAIFGDADRAATAARYRAAGAGLAIVKDGPGAVLISEGDAFAEVAPAPVAELVDTTAAGDAFNAGFFAASSAGAPTVAAVEAACRISAQVIGQRGALVDI